MTSITIDSSRENDFRIFVDGKRYTLEEVADLPNEIRKRVRAKLTPGQIVRTLKKKL